jgi:hypothetical protein
VTACETFDRTNRWVPHITRNSPSHPQDNPAQPLERLNSHKKPE